MSKAQKQTPVQSRQRREQRRTRWFWYGLIITGVFLFTAAGMTLLQGDQDFVQDNNLPSSGPRVAVDTERIDYGDVAYNTQIRTIINVKNVGDETLRILGVPQVELIEGCWPPTSDIGSMSLNPGDTTKIALNFTMPKGMGGPHEFRVHLRTNDPLEPEKEFIILSNWVE